MRKVSEQKKREIPESISLSALPSTCRCSPCTGMHLPLLPMQRHAPAPAPHTQACTSGCYCEAKIRRIHSASFSPTQRPQRPPTPRTTLWFSNSLKDHVNLKCRTVEKHLARCWMEDSGHKPHRQPASPSENPVSGQREPHSATKLKQGFLAQG